jgi:hypothetical protein
MVLERLVTKYRGVSLTALPVPIRTIAAAMKPQQSDGPLSPCPTQIRLDSPTDAGPAWVSCVPDIIGYGPSLVNQASGRVKDHAVPRIRLRAEHYHLGPRSSWPGWPCMIGHRSSVEVRSGLALVFFADGGKMVLM